MKRQTVKFTIITAFLAAMLLTFSGCPVTPVTGSPAIEQTFEVRFQNETTSALYMTIGNDTSSGSFSSAIDSIPLVKAGTTSSYYTVRAGSYLCYDSADDVSYSGTAKPWTFEANKKYTVKLSQNEYFLYEDGRASRSAAELSEAVREAQKSLTSMRNRAE